MSRNKEAAQILRTLAERLESEQTESLHLTFIAETDGGFMWGYAGNADSPPEKSLYLMEIARYKMMVRLLADTQDSDDEIKH